jgi:coenzyme F420-0:L-glutamate ligase/coenzyme F420-1:gamma-L-glutamate ligase
MEPSDQAIDLARTNQKSAAFREAMLRELARLNGRVVNRNNSVLTEVRPEGMDGSIVISSAGLDESNADGMYAIGWPKDPVTSAVALRHALKERCKKNVAVVVTDSCCHPRRIGVTAFALVVVGFDPIENYIGKKDLFGRQLLVTREARADQLATAANFLMGNADQAIPAVIVRGHGLPFSDFAGWVPGIKKEEDMFNIG